MRLLSWFVLPPLMLATLYLAVANRQRVLFSLDPFNPENPALALDTPLWLIVLVAVFLGILIGGTSAWLRQSRWRKEARESRKLTRTAVLNEEKNPENLPIVTSSLQNN